MNARHPANKTRILTLLLTASLMVLLVASRAETAGFRLIYTNDNLGELDGCG